MSETRYRTPKTLSALVILLALVVGVQAYYLRAMHEDISAKTDSSSAAMHSGATTNAAGAAMKDATPQAEHSVTQPATGANEADSNSKLPPPANSTKPNARQPQSSASTQLPGPQDEFFNQPFDADHWDPFSEMQRMRSQMDRMFADSFSRFDRSPMFGNLVQTETFTPNLDVTETDDAYVVKADLPGIDASNVKVTLKDRLLTIEGTRKESMKQSDKKGRVIRQEREYGSFSRSVTLPGPVDDLKMKTDQQDGILTVTIPKAKNS